MNVVRDQKFASIRFFSAGLGLCAALGFLFLMGAWIGDQIGQVINQRDAETQSGPWTSAKAAEARAECANRHSGIENEAARKRCLERIPFDGDWLTAPSPGPSAAQAPR